VFRSVNPVLLQIGHINLSDWPPVCPLVLFGSSFGGVERLLLLGGDSIKSSESEDKSRKDLLKYEDMSLDTTDVFFGEIVFGRFEVDFEPLELSFPEL